MEALQVERKESTSPNGEQSITPFRHMPLAARD
jgi:hypothetical protein